MKDINLLQGVDFSHWILSRQIEEGDLVVDATMGNGHDTLFLAELVGKKGNVIAFDIQEKAIASTRNKLKKSSFEDNVKLICDSHARIGQYLDDNEPAPAAVLFNLGYLPGSDKNIITKSKSTIEAVEGGLAKLEKGGIIVLVIYVGHEGGSEEKEALIEYASNLDQKKFNVLYYNFLNQANRPPEVMVIKKRK